MNHDSMAQACFVEVYVVPPHQAARLLFARRPHAQAYADMLIDCIAADYLVAVIEARCIKEMQRHIDVAVEAAVGHSVRLEHRCPIPSGATILVIGWCEQLGRSTATFRVHVFDDHAFVCDGQVTLVAANRRLIESAIAAKSAGLVAMQSLRPDSLPGARG